MLAGQLSDLQAYAQQRTAELGIEPGHVPARVQEFVKGSAAHAEHKSPELGDSGSPLWPLASGSSGSLLRKEPLS
jgi:hypothetical protein